MASEVRAAAAAATSTLSSSSSSSAGTQDGGPGSSPPDPAPALSASSPAPPPPQQQQQQQQPPPPPPPPPAPSIATTSSAAATASDLVPPPPQTSSRTDTANIPPPSFSPVTRAASTTTTDEDGNSNGNDIGNGNHNDGRAKPSAARRPRTTTTPNDLCNGNKLASSMLLAEAAAADAHRGYRTPLLTTTAEDAVQFSSLSSAASASASSSSTTTAVQDSTATSVDLVIKALTSSAARIDLDSAVARSPLQPRASPTPLFTTTVTPPTPRALSALLLPNLEDGQSAAAAAAAAASSWSSASASAQRGATPNTASGAAPNNEDARSVLSIPVSEPPVYFDSDKYAQNVYTTVLWKLRRTYGFPVLYVVPFVALLLVFNTTRGDGGNLRYGIYGLAVAVVLITPLGLYVVYRSRVRRLQAALQMGLLADTPVDQVNAIVMYEAPLPNAPLYDANAIRYDEPLPLYNTRPPSIQERPREVAPRPSSPSLRERFANLVRIGSNTSMSTQQRQHLPRTRSGLSLSSASSSPQQQAGSVAGPHDVSPTPDPQNLNVAQRLLAPSLRVGRSRSNSVASSELVDEPGSLSLTELPRVGPSLRDTPDLIDVPMSSSLPVRPGPSLSNLREITGSVNPSASFSSSSSSSSMIGSQLAHEAEAGDIVLEVPSTAVTASPTVPRPRGRLWFRPANATPVLSNTSSDFPTANSMSLAPNRPREAPRARSDVLNDPTRNAVVVEVPTSNFIDKLIQRNRGPVVLSETKLTDRQYEAVARAERRAAQLNAAMIERAIQLRNRMREGQTAEGTSSAQAEGGTDISDAVVETTPAYGPSFSSSSSSSAAWASSSSPSSSISVTPIPPIQNDDLQLNLPSRPVVVAGTPTPSSSSLTTAVAPSQQPQQTDSPTSAGPASASSSGGASDVAVSTPTTLASNLTGPANTTSSANGKAPWDGSRELNGLRVAVEE